MSPFRARANVTTAGGGLHMRQPSMYETLNQLPVVNNHNLSGPAGNNANPLSPTSERANTLPDLRLPTPPKTTGSGPTQSYREWSNEAQSLPISQEPRDRLLVDSRSGQNDAALMESTRQVSIKISEGAPGCIYKRSSLLPGYSDKVEAEVRFHFYDEILSIAQQMVMSLMSSSVL